MSEHYYLIIGQGDKIRLYLHVFTENQLKQIGSKRWRLAKYLFNRIEAEDKDVVDIILRHIDKRTYKQLQCYGNELLELDFNDSFIAPLQSNRKDG